MRWVVFAVGAFCVILFICILSIGSGITYRHPASGSFFRLESIDAFRQVFAEIRPNCSDVCSCELQRGDILVRRMLTPKVVWFVTILRPYYTHMAVYSGAGQIVEAVGEEVSKDDEIIRNRLVGSDWCSSDNESFVVLRAMIDAARLDAIVAEMERVADDESYGFGPASNGETKNRTCTSLVYLSFEKEGVVEPMNTYYMSPDYFVQYALNRPDVFEVVGASVAQRIAPPKVSGSDTLNSHISWNQGCLNSNPNCNNHRNKRVRSILHYWGHFNSILKRNTLQIPDRVFSS